MAKRAVVKSRFRLLYPLIFLLLNVCFGSARAVDGVASQVAVNGIVTDSSTGQPLPYVTVQVLGAARSTLTNDEGKYRLLVTPGTYQLKFSHVSHYSRQVQVNVADSALTLNVALAVSLIEINGIRVFEKNYNPAQQIMIQAIAAKKRMLERLKTYNYNAYLKIVARDASKQDSVNILAIIESQMQGFWQQPNKSKQVIVSRRQSANLPAGEVITSLGDILDFYKNRNQAASFDIVSPLADDALDYYNFYLLDTVMVDSLRALVLEIEPKSSAEPLFVGTLQIADSTFGLMSFDVRFNEAVRLPMVKDIHFVQHFARFDNEYSMPIDAETGFTLNLKVPGFPSHITVSAVASLHHYAFESLDDKVRFDEFAVEVDPDADKPDSTAWDARQTIPLTAQELRGYRRIDSLEHHRPVGKRIGGAAAGILLGSMFNPDLFRFNRVEGAYLGIGTTLHHVLPRTDLRLSTGYAFDAKYWENEYSLTHRLNGHQRVEFGITYENRMARRPAIFAGQDPLATIGALVDQWDPVDYFRQEGFSAWGSTRLLNQTRFKMTYRNVHQYSAPVVTDYRMFQDHKLPRDNPPIVNGALRSLAAEFTYDSRRRYLNKGTENVAWTERFTVLTAGIEYSSLGSLKSDFDFRRYSLTLDRRQPIPGLGRITVFACVGASDGALPPQRYFTVDYGGDFVLRRMGFTTVNESNFSGNRMALVTARHEFGRRLFYKSGLPLIKKLPFNLSVFGGVFWTEFRNHPPQPGDSTVRTARSAYSETGFGVGNLTPFLAPFNFGLDFAWQLSAYDTSRFNISWRLDF
jgi:hypothetical protein